MTFETQTHIVKFIENNKTDILTKFIEIRHASSLTYWDFVTFRDEPKMIVFKRIGETHFNEFNNNSPASLITDDKILYDFAESIYNKLSHERYTFIEVHSVWNPAENQYLPYFVKTTKDGHGITIGKPKRLSYRDIHTLLKDVSVLNWPHEHKSYPASIDFEPCEW